MFKHRLNKYTEAYSSSILSIHNWYVILSLFRNKPKTPEWMSFFSFKPKFAIQLEGKTRLQRNEIIHYTADCKKKRKKDFGCGQITSKKNYCSSIEMKNSVKRQPDQARPWIGASYIKTDKFSASHIRVSKKIQKANLDRKNKMRKKHISFRDKVI